MKSQLIPLRMATAPKAKAAIVFVHGFTGDIEKTWGEFPALLRDDLKLDGWDIYAAGYDSHLRLDVTKIWSADPNLDKVALKLRTDAKAGMLSPYESLCLIAHSMGGLAVQRALVDDKALRDRTSHLFLFGTPSGGLVKASLIRFLKPQLRDMSRDGKFIKALRADWDRRVGVDNNKSLPFRFFAVAGQRDEFVPFESSLGPFTGDTYADCQYVVPGDHLRIVKPVSADSPSVQLVIKGILGDAAPAGPGNSARVAVESRDFRRAIALLEPNQDKLDDEGAIQLALALEGVGRQDEALELLKRRGRKGTDAMGVLAGRLKRRWLLSRKDEDAQAARGLYADALAQARAKPDPAQCYYHGINLAFFDLAYAKDTAKAKRQAKSVLDDCRQAQDAELATDRKWRLATEGEALLVLGDFEAALARYRQAADPAQEATPENCSPCTSKRPTSPG